MADGKQLAKRVTVEDIFLANSLSVDLAMPDDDSDGDGNDKPSYLTSLCYLFTGSVLYGQKNDGGLKTHVFDILNKADKRNWCCFNIWKMRFLYPRQKETLMDNLTMSEFLINKTVQELNTDFYEFGLDDEFGIVTDGTVIKLNASGLATSDTVLTYYLDQSLKFSMLKECFLNSFLHFMNSLRTIFEPYACL